MQPGRNRLGEAGHVGRLVSRLVIVLILFAEVRFVPLQVLVVSRLHVTIVEFDSLGVRIEIGRPEQRVACL